MGNQDQGMNANQNQDRNSDPMNQGGQAPNQNQQGQENFDRQQNQQSGTQGGQGDQSRDRQQSDTDVNFDSDQSDTAGRSSDADQ